MPSVVSQDQASLSTDITVITAEINSYKQLAGHAIFEIGRRLKHVKENDLAHGEWERWCRDAAGFDRTTAFRFIKVYEELGAANVAPWQQVGIKALYEIASLPPEERDREHTLKSGEAKKPEDMTVRELREVKEALRREREAREKAERDYETVRETLESVTEAPPRIEVRTEYVRDMSAEERLRRYEERFGDLSLHESTSLRIPSEVEVEGLVLGFSEDVRDSLKRYSFLEHYAEEYSHVSELARGEYGRALAALGDFVTTLTKSVGKRKSNVVIDVN